MRCTTVMLSALAATLGAAHGDHSAEKIARSAFFAHNSRDLSHCAAKIKARGLEQRNMQRRKDLAADLIAKKGLLKSRALSTLNESHLVDADYTLNTPEDVLFANNNSSCVLSPEVTIGPYYVAGEYIRSNLTETQEGVDLRLDLQVLDMTTCEPIVGAYAEIWSANATGVYSGVSVDGNGDGTSDPGNLDKTFLRGVQPTDEDGVVVFDTLFPGYYAGRTTHIHVLVHLNATPEANGTIMDTTASHSGQVFFDQDLIDSVEALSPYTTNTQTGMTNDEDDIFAQEAASSDPVASYVLLGDSLDDGLLGWLAFGINTTYSRDEFVAAYLYESGGVSSGETYDPNSD